MLSSSLAFSLCSLVLILFVAVLSAFICFCQKQSVWFRLALIPIYECFYFVAFRCSCSTTFFSIVTCCTRLLLIVYCCVGFLLLLLLSLFFFFFFCFVCFCYFCCFCCLLSSWIFRCLYSLYILGTGYLATLPATHRFKWKMWIRWIRPRSLLACQRHLRDTLNPGMVSVWESRMLSHSRVIKFRFRYAFSS